MGIVGDCGDCGKGSWGEQCGAVRTRDVGNCGGLWELWELCEAEKYMKSGAVGTVEIREKLWERELWRA